MGLTDALLLDPLVPMPFNVWIAYRTDHVAGSGTASDPYDGSTELAAPVTVTNLSNTGPDPREAVAVGTAPGLTAPPTRVAANVSWL